MQLAMLLRDSGGRSARREADGSEWTVASRPGLVSVALLAEARQQLLGLVDTAGWKVSIQLAGCCYIHSCLDRAWQR
jgi:hypothetical protein